MCKRDQDGSTVTAYAHQSGTINESVASDVRHSSSGSVSNRGFSGQDVQRFASMSLEHAEQEAFRLFKQGTTLCNHFTLQLDSDVSDSPDGYSGSYDMHIERSTL